ncbi:CotH kinase family protein [Collinsella tanakaei]|nr:CotH kinase family protein [Collinsella tanakaei]
MNKRVLVAFVCITLLIGAGVAQVLIWNVEEAEVIGQRYLQHEQDSSLSDLSEEDQAAASSLSTDPATFATHLPVVSIDTHGQTIPGEKIDMPDDESDEEKVESAGFFLGVSETENPDSPKDYYTVAADGRPTIATTFTLYAQEGQANSLSDQPALQTQAELRYRGHSSRLFDKKGYDITFTEEDRTTNKNLDVLGMGEDEDWILHGPFIDKTLLRNYFVMNVVGQFMPYIPDVRFCELFVNGQYQGVYVLMETVKANPYRTDLTETDNNSEETSYIVRLDWEDTDSSDSIEEFLYTILRIKNAKFEIVYPSPNLLSDEQRQWITDNLTDIEKALYSYDYDTFFYGYWNTLDVDSFIDYVIVSEFTTNLDQGYYSTYFYRDIRGKLSAGPVWDYNNAFDNYLEGSSTEVGFVSINKPIVLMLFKDESFTQGCIDRYRELRKGVLSTEYLNSLIDETIEYLGPAIQRNFSVWGYSFDPNQVDDNNRLFPLDRNPASYEEAVEDLKSYMDRRLSWLDDHIENLKQYSHESAVKRYNH